METQRKSNEQKKSNSTFKGLTAVNIHSPKPYPRLLFHIGIDILRASASSQYVYFFSRWY